MGASTHKLYAANVLHCTRLVIGRQSQPNRSCQLSADAPLLVSRHRVLEGALRDGERVRLPNQHSAWRGSGMLDGRVTGDPHGAKHERGKVGLVHGGGLTGVQRYARATGPE
eukprot:COSAG01_NODE_21172_length_915_cov_0.878676_2_plen_112_part_00